MKTYLDLFSGIGGFALGFKQAGYKFEKTYHSEIDKYAEVIYEKHFPESVKLGDIRKIRPEKLRKVDFVTFGFPCQDLSIAGKRKGMEGSRSGLFFEAMRIIRKLRPSVFIFENVKGLFSSNDRKDFELVLREIADIGLYECEWQLLNTSWFLPQDRERIYFIGHFGKGSGQKVFPIEEKSTKNNKDGEQGKIIRLLGYSNGKQGYAQGKSILGKHGIYGTLQAQKRSLDAILINSNSGIRFLTPIECERLQGFPDDWTKGISDNQRYKTLGNAVSVPVVKEIATRLKLC